MPAPLPSRPVHRSPQSAPSNLRVVCIAALCSFVAGAATSWMIVRRSDVSPSSANNTAVPVVVTPLPLPDNFPPPTVTHNDPSPPSGDSPVPVYASQASVLDTPPGPSPDPARLLAQPAAAAASSLELANTVLQVSDFVNSSGIPGGHIDLYNNLIVLKLAAEAMLSDNGSDPDRTARLNSTLYEQINQAMNRADTIANRASETDEAKAVSAKLKDSLRVLRAK
jgi:hypothetical protein